MSGEFDREAHLKAVGGDHISDRECPFCSWSGPSNALPAHLGKCPETIDARRPSAGGAE